MDPACYRDRLSAQLAGAGTNRRSCIGPMEAIILHTRLQSSSRVLSLSENFLLSEPSAPSNSAESFWIPLLGLFQGSSRAKFCVIEPLSDKVGNFLAFSPHLGSGCGTAPAIVFEISYLLPLPGLLNFRSLPRDAYRCASECRNSHPQSIHAYDHASRAIERWQPKLRQILSGQRSLCPPG